MREYLDQWIPPLFVVWMLYLNCEHGCNNKQSLVPRE